MNIEKITREIEDEIINIRRKIHKYPELSTKEFKTTELVKNELEKMDIEIETFEKCTGAIGIIKGNKPGKTIAIRADMDALPIEEKTDCEFISQNKGIMHACGHDVHTAVLLGTAKILSNYKEYIEGNIKLIFQPSEEKTLYGISGSQEMILNGVLKSPDVDAIVGIHCWPELPVGTIGVKNGAMMASSDTINIEIKGKGGHAAHPHKCIDSVLIGSYVVTELQTLVSREISPIDSAVITIGQMKAGTAGNVIAEKMVMKGTLRTVNPETREKLNSRIKEKVNNIAKNFGGEAEVKIIKGSPCVFCNEDIVNTVENAIKDNLKETNVVRLEYPSLGSEDFSYYLEKVPGAFIRLGTSNEDKRTKLGLHSSEIIFDEKSIFHGISTLSAFALKYLKYL